MIKQTGYEEARQTADHPRTIRTWDAVTVTYISYLRTYVFSLSWSYTICTRPLNSFPIGHNPYHGVLDALDINLYLHHLIISPESHLYSETDT